MADDENALIMGDGDGKPLSRKFTSQPSNTYIVDGTAYPITGARLPMMNPGEVAVEMTAAFDPVTGNMGSKIVQPIKEGVTRTAYANTFAIGATGNGVTVPANKFWKVLGVTVDVVCSATVGNRVIIGRVGNIYWVGPASAATTAGQTCGYDIGFGNAVAPSTTIRRNIANTGNTNIQVICSCPYSILGAGDTITIQDTAAVDVADSITWRMYYIEYDA